MKVIPVINCEKKECVRERIKIFKDLGSDWIKFDISDGKFNPVLSWNSPEDLEDEFGLNSSVVNIEVHLMALKPLPEVKRWLGAGAKRVILHVESDFDLDEVLELCSKNEAELMMAVNPDSSWKKLKPFLDKVDHVQFLAVTPGYSGQEMKSDTLKKIKSLRESYPDVKIEVDGGINEKTAKKVKEAGADIVVSSSYIFKSDNPKEAFEKLKSISSG